MAKQIPNPDWAYEDVKNMLFKLAWQYKDRYNLTFEDALREVYWGFARALTRYNPKKHASFSSWCYFVANKKLQGLIRERSKDRLCFIDMNEELVGAAPTDRSPCLEVVEGLSKEARQIIEMLLETPAELLEETCTPKQLLGRVRDYLIERRILSKKQFVQADQEIREAFNEVWA